MSSPNSNRTVSPTIPPYKQRRSRSRASSIYTQSNAAPIQPTPGTFGGDSESASTFYSFPRLPDGEESGEPACEQPATLPSGKIPTRTPSFSKRIATSIRSLLPGTRPADKPEEKETLLSLSREDYEAGKQQKTSDGAHVFCQHILNDDCQCTVTMPIAVGRNLCQTCADGECAAAVEGTNPNQELKCSHLWLDSCQCTRSALWITGDSFCGPCWYGQCPGGDAGSDVTKES